MATGKHARVFVIDIVEFDVLIGPKGGKPHSFPVEEIFRHRQCDSRTARRKCRVAHDVTLQRFYKGDARILTAASAPGPLFIISLRFECDAQPLDTYRIAVFIEAHARDANARVVAMGSQPREEVKLAIGPRTAAGLSTPSTS